VDADEGGKPIRLQGNVDLVQGDLSWILAKFRAALPPGHRNESCLLQGTEGVADHNRIAAGALRQQRTRDTRSVSGLPDKEQAVHRYGTFHTNLHDKALSCQSEARRKDVNVDITSRPCYTISDVNVEFTFILHASH